MPNPDKTVVQSPIAVDTLSPGTVIANRYRLERLLGQGGMGVVYLAVHVALNKLVALKMLQPHLARRPEFIARFHREAEALARLHHPHIVGVTDFGNESGGYYLVFDYIEGGTLESCFLDRGAAQFDVAEITRLLSEILRGVEHAHRSGIIHRDLKPANILLEKTGEVKISDFGLARVIGDEAHRALVAQTQASIAAGSGATSGYVGTADFMAPEVKLLRPADERSDLYAIGVIGYWLLTGRRPSAMAPAVTRAAKGRKLDRGWNAFMDRALAEDPGARFQSATEMLAGLEHLRAAPGRNRHPLFIGLALGLVAGAGMLGFWALRQPAPEPVAASQTYVLPSALQTPTLQLRGLPAGAEVSVAGGSFVPAEGDRTTIQVPPEGADVEVRAPHFQPWRGRAGGTGQPDVIDVALVPIRPHHVTLKALPPGARVMVGNDEFRAGSDGTVAMELMPGPITVRASARKYTAATRTVDIADSTTEVLFALEKTPPAPELTIPLDATTKLVLRRVSPGEFEAGSQRDELGRQPSDEPRTRTRIAQPFYLGVYEVTQAEYLAVMHENPSASRSLRDGRRPVEQVGWSELRAPDGFIARFNRRLQELGLPYTADLPTEREWEYACRAGTTSSLNDGHSLANVEADPALDRLATYRRTFAPDPVGQHAANAWGFYDMLGNVAEWTRDQPILRGGNWRVNAAYCRAASRMETSADARPSDTMGFRLVLRPTDE